MPNLPLLLFPPATFLDPWGVSIDAVPGRIFTLQGTTDPSGSWTDLSTLRDITTAGPATLSDPLASGERGIGGFFLRVKATMQPY